MARRRLTVPEPAAAQETAAHDGVPELKAHYPLGIAPTFSRPPIARVAGDAAQSAALDALTREVAEARVTGRLAVSVCLTAIDDAHLVRDRLTLDEDEMAALKASIVARGQQTPLELVETEEGRFGLISGWRRLAALRDLGHDTALAVIRRPEGAAAAYQAMVEENEIRSQLSFWERAHIAVTAVRLGIHPNIKTALDALFAHSPAPRRSKIAGFAQLHQALADDLRFPTAIPERLGLALARRLDRPGFAARLCAAVREKTCDSPEAERAVLEAALKEPEAGVKLKAPKPRGAEVAPGIRLERRKGRVVLSGSAVDDTLAQDLADWLASR